MLDALKPLLDSGVLTEETHTAINEAWESKLVEAKEQARAELREEFAQRYEHDKTVMVEALDRMVTEGLAVELQQVAAEKAQLAEDRVKFQSKMAESAQKFNGFLVQKLAEEIGELRKDRKTHSESLQKLEGFVVEALAKEIMEFSQDKKDLVATKVRIMREAREQLEGLKARFVKESASKMSKAVSQHLKAELNQLQEDIKTARENNFGRRIFEAYAAEFGATHLNEKAEVKKLYNLLAQKDQKLAEAVKLTEKAKVVVESKNRELRIIKESNERTELMAELLRPLNKEKQDVMRNLLESVQTPRLKNAFEKYLPAVLAGKTQQKREALVEAKEITGNKTSTTNRSSDDSNIIDMRRLAGL